MIQIKDNNENDEQNHEINHIVVSFKSIFTNDYTIFIIKKTEEEFRVEFKYTSYQLWESSVKGFVCKKNNDFIILNKEGINFIRIDAVKSRKPIKDREGSLKMVHSLCSMKFLKIEDSNMINFQNDNESEQMIIKIQQ